MTVVVPVVDMLNKKYGRDTVRLAGANPKGRWRTKAAKRGPRNTTKLTEVLRLKRALLRQTTTKLNPHSLPTNRRV
jgi:hypothetical protein